MLTAGHGFCCGMFIEGAARWGMDAVWTTDSEANEVTVDDSKLTEPDSVFHHTKDERRRWVEIKAHQKKMRSEGES